MGVSGIQSNYAETPYKGYPEYGASNCMRHMVSPGLDGLMKSMPYFETAFQTAFFLCMLLEENPF